MTHFLQQSPTSQRFHNLSRQGHQLPISLNTGTCGDVPLVNCNTLSTTLCPQGPGYMCAATLSHVKSTNHTDPLSCFLTWEWGALPHSLQLWRYVGPQLDGEGIRAELTLLHFKDEATLQTQHTGKHLPKYGLNHLLNCFPLKDGAHAAH